MRRTFCVSTRWIVFLAILVLADVMAWARVARGADVWLVDCERPGQTVACGASGEKAEAEDPVTLVFAEQAVMIREPESIPPEGHLLAQGVDPGTLYVLQDWRSPSERTGYDALYTRGPFVLARVPDTGVLRTEPDVDLEPVLRSRTVLRAHPVTALPADPLVQYAVSQVDRQEYEDQLRVLSTDFGTRFTCAWEVDDARDLIVQEFLSLGYSVEQSEFDTGCSTCAEPEKGSSVVARKAGSTRPQDRYLVMGHYDSISPPDTRCTDAPGSNDNASGTAGVMELARVFADLRTEGSLDFIAFSGEEEGLLGSRAYVEHLVAAGEIEQVKGFINLDMISWFDRSYEILLDGSDNTTEQRELLDEMAALTGTYSALGVVTSTTLGRSDHVPFLQAGRPGIMMIESEALSYPYLHTTNDLFVHQRMAYATEVLRAAAAALATWAVIEPDSGSVDLTSFYAKGNVGLVDVRWDTSTEVLNAGFHLWRSPLRRGSYSRITDPMIPSRGGPGQAASYAYEDTAVKPGSSYWYKLEAIDESGGHTLHGPVWARVPFFAPCGTPPLYTNGSGRILAESAFLLFVPQALFALILLRRLRRGKQGCQELQKSRMDRMHKRNGSCELFLSTILPLRGFNSRVGG